MNIWKPIETTSDLPKIGDRESEILDFKSSGYSNTDEEKREAARDIAQFANHLGGTLIVGAKEESHELIEYVDVHNIADEWIRLRDICIRRLSPSVKIDATPIKYDSIHVLAVNIPPSLMPVGVLIDTRRDNLRYEFPLRVNNRKKYLRFEEVKLMDTPERRGFLLLNSIPADKRSGLRIDAPHLERVPADSWSLEELDVSHAVLKGNRASADGRTVNIPLAFVEAVWPSAPNGQFVITIAATISDNELSKTLVVSKSWQGFL